MKLGELLAANPPGFTKGKSGHIKQNPLPSGVSQKVSHQAQTLSDHRDVVAQVSAKARETGSIPMASKIYKIIKTGERQEERKALVAKIPEGKFAVILADPPWRNTTTAALMNPQNLNDEYFLTALGSFTPMIVCPIVKPP